jgi:hypothetical protein|tara:strand:+ start:540 stop:683 length:144 start_codon:yes stop_codon:yes gene_type:complete
MTDEEKDMEILENMDDSIILDYVWDNLTDEVMQMVQDSYDDDRDYRD